MFSSVYSQNRIAESVNCSLKVLHESACPPTVYGDSDFHSDMGIHGSLGAVEETCMYLLDERISLENQPFKQFVHIWSFCSLAVNAFLYSRYQTLIMCTVCSYFVFSYFVSAEVKKSHSLLESSSSRSVVCATSVSFKNRSLTQAVPLTPVLLRISGLQRLCSCSLKTVLTVQYSALSSLTFYSKIRKFRIQDPQTASTDGCSRVCMVPSFVVEKPAMKVKHYYYGFLVLSLQNAPSSVSFCTRGQSDFDLALTRDQPGVYHHPDRCLPDHNHGVLTSGSPFTQYSCCFFQSYFYSLQYKNVTLTYKQRCS